MNKLSKIERLTLINQYTILAKLSAEDHEKEDYELKIEILENGFEKRYGDLIDFLSEPMPEEDSIYVNDVLDFYKDVHFAFNKLSDDEKDENLENKVKFKGFDLNDAKQSKLYSYADFMINKYNGWHYLKELVDAGEIEINSHGAEVPKHVILEYIERHNQIKKEKSNNFSIVEPLTKNELHFIFGLSNNCLSEE